MFYNKYNIVFYPDGRVTVHGGACWFWRDRLNHLKFLIKREWWWFIQQWKYQLGIIERGEEKDEG